jgi:hypothetical protein
MNLNKVTALSVFQSKWISVFAGVFCLAMVTGASADTAEKPCADDVAKFCKGEKPGGGAVMNCLKEHSSELSSACKDNMEKMKKKGHEFKEACAEDAKKLCKDEKPGGGRIKQCLKKHESELSSACKSKME